MKTQRGSTGIILLFLYPRGVIGVSGQHHAPAALPPGNTSGIQCTGDWAGLRVWLEVCRKSRPPPGFDPRTVQPVASRYTDYDIPGQILTYIINSG